MWMTAALTSAWWYTRNHGPWIDRRKGLTRSLVEGAGLALLGLILVAAAGAILPNPTTHSASLLSSMSLPKVIYLLGAIPMIEEILLRGMLFEALAPRGGLIAVAGSATVDALAHGIGHGDAAYALAILPGAVLLGALRSLTRGISVPISVHVLVNVLAT